MAKKKSKIDVLAENQKEVMEAFVLADESPVKTIALLVEMGIVTSKEKNTYKVLIPAFVAGVKCSGAGVLRNAVSEANAEAEAAGQLLTAEIGAHEMTKASFEDIVGSHGEEMTAMKAKLLSAEIDRDMMKDEVEGHEDLREEYAEAKEESSRLRDRLIALNGSGDRVRELEAEIEGMASERLSAERRAVSWENARNEQLQSAERAWELKEYYEGMAENRLSELLRIHEEAIPEVMYERLERAVTQAELPFPESVVGPPKNYRGWSLNSRKTSSGNTVYNLQRSVPKSLQEVFGKKKISLYLGKWDQTKADQKIDSAPEKILGLGFSDGGDLIWIEPERVSYDAVSAGYEVVRDRTGFSNVPIADVRDEIGVDAGVFETWLLSESQAGRVILALSDWSCASERERKAAVMIGGKPHLLMRIEPESVPERKAITYVMLRDVAVILDDSGMVPLSKFAEALGCAVSDVQTAVTENAHRIPQDVEGLSFYYAVTEAREAQKRKTGSVPGPEPEPEPEPFLVSTTGRETVQCS